MAVHVADTGIGIAADKFESIFDPFVQIDANYTRTRDGVGLGLAISKAIVEAHGGTIWAESTMGEGSRLCFTLPTAPR